MPMQTSATCECVHVCAWWSRLQGFGVIPGDNVDINRRDVLVTGLAGAQQQHTGVFVCAHTHLCVCAYALEP